MGRDTPLRPHLLYKQGGGAVFQAWLTVPLVSAERH